MKRILPGVLVVAWCATATLSLAAERWVHIRVVDNGADGEKVRVNVPLSLAEKVLPTIKVDCLQNGKVKVSGHQFDEVDLHALLEAIRGAQDNEFVSVDSRHDNVRVAKAGGLLLVKVRENEGGKTARPTEKPRGSSVDIKVPLTVVDALLSGGTDELDLVAALKALRDVPDTELVSVNDESNAVRIWVDSRNTTD